MPGPFHIYGVDRAGNSAVVRTCKTLEEARAEFELAYADKASWGVVYPTGGETDQDDDGLTDEEREFIEYGAPYDDDDRAACAPGADW